MDNNMKECITCKKAKPLNNFYIEKKSQKPYRRCKECEAIRCKEYKERTKYNRNENRAQVRKEAKEGETKKCSTCGIEKPQNMFEKRRNQCYDCRKAYIQNYHKRENVIKSRRFYVKEKRKIDPKFMIKFRLRARLAIVLRKAKNAHKSDSTMDIVGCSINVLIKYLEDQFTEGMHWFHKDLSIDHKVPCAMFDLTDEKEQKRCFHYTNLKPMWLSDNIKKKDKLLPEYEELYEKLKTMFI